MRIMTSNIWGNYFGNPPEERADGLIKTYEKYLPDIIGFQEVKDDWYETKLFKKLSKKYRFAGTEFLYKSNDMHSPIAYKNQFKLIASGFEYLKTDWEDPSKAITWVVLNQPNSDKYFAVCNTHFWWPRGERHDLIREDNANQMVSLAKSLHAKFSCPVFIIGDMNTTIKSTVFDVYERNGIINLYNVAKSKKDVSSDHGDPIRDEKGVLRGKTTVNGHAFSLDHILSLNSPYKVERHVVVVDQEALDSTDHSPVFVDIDM